MKSTLFFIIMNFFLFSFVSADQKNVLKEGYHFPGGSGGYIQPTVSQPVNNQKLDAQINDAKNKYDSCMKNIKKEFSNDLVKNFEIVMKRNECQRYMDIYENLMYSKYNAQNVSGKPRLSNEKVEERNKLIAEEEEKRRKKKKEKREEEEEEEKKKEKRRQSSFP